MCLWKIWSVKTLKFKKKTRQLSELSLTCVIRVESRFDHRTLKTCLTQTFKTIMPKPSCCNAIIYLPCSLNVHVSFEDLSGTLSEKRGKA